MQPLSLLPLTDPCAGCCRSPALQNVRVGNFFGGLPIKQQREQLKDKDKCPHIIVGTPGRVKGVSPAWRSPRGPPSQLTGAFFARTTATLQAQRQPAAPTCVVCTTPSAPGNPNPPRSWPTSATWTSAMCGTLWWTSATSAWRTLTCARMCR